MRLDRQALGADYHVETVMSEEPAHAAGIVLQRSTHRLRPADRGLRVPGAAAQVLVTCCTLLAGSLGGPFFFCLGFLASRVDRFCSLFAISFLRHKLRPAGILALAAASAGRAIRSRQPPSSWLGQGMPAATSYA